MSIELLQAIGMQPPGLRKVSPAATARESVLEHGYVPFLPRLTVAGDLAPVARVRLAVEDMPAWSCDVVVAYRDRRSPDPALSVSLRAVRSAQWAE